MKRGGFIAAVAAVAVAPALPASAFRPGAVAFEGVFNPADTFEFFVGARFTVPGSFYAEAMRSGRIAYTYDALRDRYHFFAPLEVWLDFWKEYGGRT
jgi:hypothetical protein